MVERLSTHQLFELIFLMSLNLSTYRILFEYATNIPQKARTSKSKNIQLCLVGNNLVFGTPQELSLNFANNAGKLMYYVTLYKKPEKSSPT